MILVYGNVILAEGGPPFDDATIYVRLEDVSRVDSASTVVAEQVIHHVTASSVPIPFSLSGELPDQQALYNVSVHVDVNNDGTLSKGDYLSMESYPVITLGYPRQITIRVYPL